MIDCPNGDIRDLLPDFLHGRLDAAEHALVAAHLRGCELCREELALLRDLRGALRRGPRVDVGRITAAIPPRRAPVREPAARHWSGWRIAAAITLLAAGGTSLAVVRHGARPGVDTTHVATVRSARSLPGSAPVNIATTAPTPSPRGSSSATSSSAAPRELALAGGTISELDDRELSALLDDIGSLDAVPSADVDTPATISPIAPSSPSGMNN